MIYSTQEILPFIGLIYRGVLMIRSNRKQGMYESSPVTFHLRLLCGKLVAAAAGEVLVLVV